MDAIHVLVTGDTPAKAVVRNIESALMAQLGLKASSKDFGGGDDAPAGDGRTADRRGALGAASGHWAPRVLRGCGASRFPRARRDLQGDAADWGRAVCGRSRGDRAERPQPRGCQRARGADGAQPGRSDGRDFSLEGAKLIAAFEREFVFAAVMARSGREQVLLTGSAEVRDSAETAAVLAVLDATNRWMATLAAGETMPVIEERRGLR